MTPGVSAANTYSELSGLQSINVLAKTDSGAALGQVARQFESFFLAQLLKGMRAANELFAKDDPTNSNEMQFRQEMLDQQLSVSLTAGKGLGLASVFERQLRQQFGAGAGADDTGAEADARHALDQSGLTERRVERAPMRASTQMVPPVVRNALRLIEPIVQQIQDRTDGQGEFADKASFVRAVLPEARRVAAELGVDHRVLVAQAALETGWGQSVIRDAAGRSSFNLFNIKAGSFWEGRSVGVRTLEFRNGIPRPEQARFRAYSSFADSFADYARLLRENPRYHGALTSAGDPGQFIQGLQRAGYATDPAYASKVMNLLRDRAISGAEWHDG